MKKKNGFTLIELLAVIVILAIIALIATPIVMNLIGKARQKSAEDSTYGIIKAGETFFVEQWADDENYNGGVFTCANANLSGGLKCKDSNNNYLEFNGTQPTGGQLEITSEGKVLINEPLVINGYSCSYKAGSTSIVNCSKGNAPVTPDPDEQTPDPDEQTPDPDEQIIIPTTYVTGTKNEVTMIYYNPVTAQFCSKKDYDTNLGNYNTTNTLSDGTKSPTGLKIGCMKWYAIENSDSSKSTVKVILDHNTTALASWNATGSNASMGTGTYDAQTYLNKLVSESGWQVTPTLIEANEIASITGHPTFDQSSSVAVQWFYLDSNNQTTNATSQNASNYTWLFNNTYVCISNGCNVEDNNSYVYDGTNTNSIQGYWTKTAVSGLSSNAWFVYRNSALHRTAVSIANTYGVRPVITISKPNI